MNMEILDKKLTALIEGLADKKTTLATIEKIRDKGNVKILPYIFEVLFNNPSEDVYKAIKNMLFDIKDIKAVPYIFDAISNEKYKNHQAFLVSMLWEAGLDCKDKTEELINLSINSDPLTIIEILTVIENFEITIPKKEASKYKAIITKTIKVSADLSKNKLLESLLSVIDLVAEK